MRIRDLYRQKRPILSIEIFPPKTPEGIVNLKQRLVQFKEYRPDYISVTYGAGGSTRSNTHAMATYIKNELGIEAMAHLTCVAHTQGEIDQVLDALKQANIENIMALRGDPPQGTTQFVPAEGGFRYANELIAMLKQKNHFGIGAAGYPEGHAESKSLEEDRRNLLKKIDAGAEFIVTQFFLDNRHFLLWRDKLRREGVKVPLIPGILPAQSFEQITRFAATCGCKVPLKLLENLQKHTDDEKAQRQVGLDFAAAQINDLIKEGVEGMHLYALNRLDTIQTLAPLVLQ